jgi:hypothetical protein
VFRIKTVKGGHAPTHAGAFSRMLCQVVFDVNAFAEHVGYPMAAYMGPYKVVIPQE